MVKSLPDYASLEELPFLTPLVVNPGPDSDSEAERLPQALVPEIAAQHLADPARDAYPFFLEV